MLDITFPANLSDEGAKEIGNSMKEIGKEMGKEFGAVATVNILKILDNHTTRVVVYGSFFLIGAYMAFNAYLALRSAASVHHEVVHRGAGRTPRRWWQ